MSKKTNNKLDVEMSLLEDELSWLENQIEGYSLALRNEKRSNKKKALEGEISSMKMNAVSLEERISNLKGYMQ